MYVSTKAGRMQLSRTANTSSQFWLLGYEFPTTLMLFTLDTLYILTTQKKAKYLDQIKGGRFPVEVLVRGKDAAENEKLFVKITDAIKAAGVSHDSLCPLPRSPS
jgi:nucleosome binding factor SPN SPT16 subunit